MNQFKAFLTVLLIIVTVSCDFQNYAMPPYDGEISWELIAENPDFSNRTDHAAVSFDGKLWVFGGYDQSSATGDSFKEDIWCSNDGVSWVRVHENAPWNGRQGHSIVEFMGTLFLYGGFEVDESTGHRQYSNDIWTSGDGINWTEVTDSAPWPARFEHSVVQANHSGTDYLYLLGGSSMSTGVEARYSMTYYNDIWRSIDGINWTELTPTLDYGGRSSQAAVVDPISNRLYVFGGLYTVIFDDAADGYMNGYPSYKWDQLWYTDDGTNWNFSERPSGLRADHNMIFLDSRMWLLPGRNNSSNHYNFGDPTNYRTYVHNGGGWSLDSEGSGIGARHGYAVVSHNGKIWVIGGITADDGPDNDIWTAEIY